MAEVVGAHQVDRECIVLLDFGAQYSQLIARQIRAKKVYCEILPYDTSLEDIGARNPKGIILSGGPASVLEPSSPRCDEGIFHMNVPVLGICYGMQLMAKLLGGTVKEADDHEYGKVEIEVEESRLLQGLDKKTTVWMSHTYQVDEMPQGFKQTAHSPHCHVAAMEDPSRGLFAVQFHPEVTHTLQGKEIFENFLFDICGCSGDWQMSNYAQALIQEMRERIGDQKVLLGLSGGVDSAVVAALLHEAIGEQLTCVFVDHGLLRTNEREDVEAVFRPRLGDRLIVHDASDRFLGKLAGVTDPETKRKIIGKEFIEVFTEAAKGVSGIDYLAQGTIYPDVIESGFGSAAVIKSHHNVGGLPDRIDFKGIIEPLRYLFKDEVRALGEELGLPEAIVWRQPFPGPGLAIRVIGDITREKLDILRATDFILRQEIEKNQLRHVARQYFTVLTGIRSVGVMGDERSYDYTIALRVVNTTDFMTADWVRLPYEVLETISRRIVNEVRHVNRIVYDITSKPPASIEWE